MRLVNCWDKTIFFLSNFSEFNQIAPQKMWIVRVSCVHINLCSTRKGTIDMEKIRDKTIHLTVYGDFGQIPLKMKSMSLSWASLLKGFCGMVSNKFMMFRSLAITGHFQGAKYMLVLFMHLMCKFIRALNIPTFEHIFIAMENVKYANAAKLCGTLYIAM